MWLRRRAMNARVARERGPASIWTRRLTLWMQTRHCSRAVAQTRKRMSMDEASFCLFWFWYFQFQRWLAHDVGQRLSLLLSVVAQLRRPMQNVQLVTLLLWRWLVRWWSCSSPTLRGRRTSAVVTLLHSGGVAGLFCAPSMRRCWSWLSRRGTFWWTTPAASLAAPTFAGCWSSIAPTVPTRISSALPPAAGSSRSPAPGSALRCSQSRRSGWLTRVKRCVNFVPSGDRFVQDANVQTQPMLCRAALNSIRKQNVSQLWRQFPKALKRRNLIESERTTKEPA